MLEALDLDVSYELRALGNFLFFLNLTLFSSVK